MSNPFERADIDYKVLTNEEEQYSLWPAFIPVPQGWTVVYGQASREHCLAYIDTHWTDLRPLSLITEA
ncbi:MbtH family protein [Paenibacillus sp. N1-5-1-14]|uniref:MbtH family protein n=1 Tax=Paenibacillus radicibacter TaxID=2972488 RepID=UPI0021598AFA|nr:MbtH family protein [Paenibacillus radicibacter]MCR8642842.1 MbtH family protein [Paenibacillus radicibacter]